MKSRIITNFFKSKKIAIICFSFIIFIQIFVVFSSSIYRNLTYAEYNTTHLSEENYSFNNNLEVCNLTFKDIESKLTNQYEDYQIILKPDDKDLLNNFKNIRCIGTVSYVEINDSLRHINIFTGTSSLGFNISYLIFLILFLNLRRYNKQNYLYILSIVFLLISYDFFNISNDLHTLILVISTKVLLIACVEILIFKDFHQALNINKKSNYRKELDGLRALSVVFVIFNHLNYDILPYGYLGVDIFFVLSGYVITSSLSNSKHQDFSSFLSNFYVKRFKRLFPTLFVAVTFTYLILFKYDYYFLSTFSTGFFSLFGLSNLYLYNSSLEYFSTSAKYNPLLHTWSLGIEEQFYLFYPLILFYFLYFKKNSRQFKNFLLFLFSLSLIYFVIIFDSNFSGAYYLTHARIWQIILGAIVFSYQKNNLLNLNFDKNLLITLVIMLFVIIGPQFAVNPHISISILAGLLLIKSNKNKYSNKFLKSKLLTNLGVISYALYLWHLPIFTIKYWNDFYFLNTEVEILIILILSISTFYFLDIPIRVKNILYNFKKLNIFFLLILFFFLITFYTKPFESYAVSNNSEFDQTPVYKLVDCHLPEITEDIFEKCLVFDAEVQNIILLGDSHITNHYFPTLEANSDSNVSLLVDWSFVGAFVDQDLCIGNRSCSKNGLDDYLNYLNKKLKPKDIVVLGFTSSRVNKQNQVVFINNLNNLAEVVAKNNSTLFLVDDVPKPCLTSQLNYEKEVLIKKNYNICKINKNQSKESRGVYSQILKESSIQAYIKYIDPHDELCGQSLCTLAQDNLLLYADTSPHLTKSGSKTLYNFWSSVFDER
jgi:peptidoglycan/LPS O-acetylase OafA/YrhL